MTRILLPEGLSNTLQPQGRREGEAFACKGVQETETRADVYVNKSLMPRPLPLNKLAGNSLKEALYLASGNTLATHKQYRPGKTVCAVLEALCNTLC